MLESELHEPLSGEFPAHHRKNPLTIPVRTDFGPTTPSYKPPSTPTPTYPRRQHKPNKSYPIDERDDGACSEPNRYIYDDQAFHDLVTALMSQLETRGTTPQQILLDCLSQTERHDFSEALKSRMSNLPTFPESREDRITFMTRKADGVFRGPLRNLCTKFFVGNGPNVGTGRSSVMNASVNHLSQDVRTQLTPERQLTPPKRKSDAYSTRASSETVKYKHGIDATPRTLNLYTGEDLEDDIYRSARANGKHEEPNIGMSFDCHESPMSSVTDDIIAKKDTDNTSFTHARSPAQNGHHHTEESESDPIYRKTSCSPPERGTDDDTCKTPLHCPTTKSNMKIDDSSPDRGELGMSPFSPLSSITSNSGKIKERALDWDEETNRLSNRKRPRIRQKIVREIQKASQILKHSSDPSECATYGRYIGHLKKELEFWGDTDDQSKKLQTNLEKEMLHAENIVQNTDDPDERGLYERYLGYLREELKIRNEDSTRTTPRGFNPFESQPVSTRNIEIEVSPSVNLREKRGSSAPHNRSRSMTRRNSVAKPASPLGPRVINVVAPENLPEHFTFEARIDDEIFLAVVPEGGVVKGQVFPSRMYDIDDDRGEREPTRVRTFQDMAAPDNIWRNDLFDCIDDGCCHPMILNSLFCPVVALSQIMARMQLNSLGRKAVTLNSRTSTRNTLIVMICTLLVHLLYLYPLVRAPTLTVFMVSLILLVLLDIGLLIHFYRMLILTRRFIKEEYRIPNVCNKQEDVFVSIFCTCCTLSQMGRHTADYETYRPYCCSDTGLPNHIEVKLPSDTPGGFSIDDASMGVV